MCPVAHTHQDRPHFKPAALHFQDVAHAGGGVGVGKNQDIGRARHAGVGEDAVADVLGQGGVGVHLSLVDEIAGLGIQDLQRGAHPDAGVAVEVAELAVRAERDFRRKAEAADVARGAQVPGQLIIYPQGTRVAPGIELPYKTGTAVLYQQLGQTCVPVAMAVRKSLASMMIWSW